jgi:hypothetical protein
VIDGEAIVVDERGLSVFDALRSDQVARDVVAFGETVECLARNEAQGDLSFELHAMGAVLGHGFHPLKARQRRSIPNLQTVHRQGRIPVKSGRETRISAKISVKKISF